MSEKTLGQLLSKKKPAKRVLLAKKELLGTAPYCQPLSQIVFRQGSEYNNSLRYDWYNPLNSEHAEPNKDCLNLGLIELKEKKKKRKKPKFEKSEDPGRQSDKFTDLHSLLTDQTATEEDTDADSEEQEALKIAKKKRKKKKKKAKKNDSIKAQEVSVESDSDLDDFTLWLNKISKISPEEFQSLENQKSTKKKSKKKKGKKALLFQKIEASNKVDDKIASKQLAELYAKQGFYDKAIEMYEKLSLNNPEKSSFFAPLIEELKQKQQ